MTRLLTLATLAIGALAACDDQPCTRYVDYMCACHSGEEGFDCDELRAIYADPGADVANQCAIDLSDQQAADDEAGLACDI